MTGMGLIKSAKQDTIANEARKAIENGRRTFAALLNSPGTLSSLSGGIDDWSAMVDAIEAEGWRLDHWTVGQDGKGRPQAYPLFRRA